MKNHGLQEAPLRRLATEHEPSVNATVRRFVGQQETPASPQAAQFTSSI